MLLSAHIALAKLDIMCVLINTHQMMTGHILVKCVERVYSIWLDIIFFLRLAFFMNIQDPSWY